MHVCALNACMQLCNSGWDGVNPGLYTFPPSGLHQSEYIQIEIESK